MAATFFTAIDVIMHRGGKNNKEPLKNDLQMHHNLNYYHKYISMIVKNYGHIFVKIVKKLNRLLIKGFYLRLCGF